MALTLRRLLENPSLHLRIVVGADGGFDAALDTEFAWLHATDMIDPTPFLGPAQVVLTLGWQFPVVDSADPAVVEDEIDEAKLQDIYDDYAARVAAYGVIGIGFGSDVLHRGIPAQLTVACERYGLILFDVPYEISFMDLLQEAARVMHRDETERYTRSLRAQMAIANAATRRDGLDGTLRETARQLGCGVALFDGVARPTNVVALPGGPRLDVDEITPIVAAVLASGQRFRSQQVTGDIEVVLQVLGEPASPVGVLVLSLSQGLDEVSRNVMSSVLALVSLALQQHQALEGVDRSLRQAVLQLLLSGDDHVAEHLVEQVWGGLASPPLVVLVGGSTQYELHLLMRSLSGITASFAQPPFFAEHRGRIVVLVDGDEEAALLERLQPLHLTIGRTHCDSWNDLRLAIEQARKAADFAARRGDAAVTDFSEIWREGISDLINPTEADLVARRLLGPLLAHDEQTGTSLVSTLHTWLSYNGRVLPAARALEIHRHTLDSRLRLIAKLTGLDLDEAMTRAELTMACQFLRG